MEESSSFQGVVSGRAVDGEAKVLPARALGQRAPTTRDQLEGRHHVSLRVMSRDAGWLALGDSALHDFAERSASWNMPQSTTPVRSSASVAAGATMASPARA